MGAKKTNVLVALVTQLAGKGTLGGMDCVEMNVKATRLLECFVALVAGGMYCLKMKMKTTTQLECWVAQVANVRVRFGGHVMMRLGAALCL